MQQTFLLTTQPFYFQKPLSSIKVWKRSFMIDFMQFSHLCLSYIPY